MQWKALWTIAVLVIISINAAKPGMKRSAATQKTVLAQKKKPSSPKCCPEKAIETVRRMLKQWPDYVNTGNITFLLKNWIQKGATITSTGDAISSRCDTRVESLTDYLYYKDSARVLGDLVNVKAIQYQRDGSVLAVFVTASGVKGHNLKLFNESWVFYPKCNCEYQLAEAAEIRVGCLKQDPTFAFNNC